MFGSHMPEVGGVCSLGGGRVGPWGGRGAARSKRIDFSGNFPGNKGVVSGNKSPEIYLQPAGNSCMGQVRANHERSGRRKDADCTISPPKATNTARVDVGPRVDDGPRVNHLRTHE